MLPNTGNYDILARKGGVIAVEIKWDCNLDLDFYKFCLPKYNFRILDESGWNFRHGKYHEENRRTLVKSFGLKFLLNVSGTAKKFDLTKTIVVLVTALGLMGIANVLCDLVLLHCSHDFREEVMKKKYEEINLKLKNKWIAENLENMLQKEGNAGESLNTLMAISSIALLYRENESPRRTEGLQKDGYM